MAEQTLSGPERAPHSGGKAKQIVILLHGLGSSGDDLIGLAPLLAPMLPDVHFLSPHAPFRHDMWGMGYQWFSLQDWSPAAMLSGIASATPFLNGYIDAQLARFNLPENKLAFIGFSQGTMMSLHVALRREKPCAGIVGFSGLMIAERDIQSKPPVCLVHGDMDMVVPYAAMGLAEAALKHLQIPVETHTRPGLGHSIDPEGIDIAVNFLKKKFNERP